MCHIYSNSHFTIAAHEPESCKAGFLRKQGYGKHTWQRPFYANLGKKDNIDNIAKMFVRPNPAPDIYQDESSALEQRGWTVQESILPTRILHFMGDEMAWECNKTTVCECGHMERNSRVGVVRYLKTSFGFGIGPDRGPNLLTYGWKRVVAEYSSRKLTQEGDKLIAISGLAQMIVDSTWSQKKLPEGAASYLAGIWRQDLPGHLLWEARNSSGRVPRDCVETAREMSSFQHTRPLEYCAPTWSWASINGPVGYSPVLDGKLNYEITISECHYNPVSILNPTGSVKSGHLVVTGSLVPLQLVTINRFNSPSGCQITDYWRAQDTLVRCENLLSYQISSDLPRKTNLREGDPCHECWKRGNHEPKECSDCHFEKSNARFYGLKVAGYNYVARSILFYLILATSPTTSNAYERVGIGCYDLVAVGDVESNFRLFENAEMVTIKIV